MTLLDPLAFAPAAFLAGILMFLAPCTLPIVPGYLAFIAAVPGGTKGANKSTRARVVRNALMFIVGFSLVFILLGTFSGLLGGFFGPWREFLGRVAGGLIILFGLTLLGVVEIPVLSYERRFHMPHFLTLGRPESSLLIGILFALGWSPCIGPILGTVLLFASTSATAVQGALLLGVFSLGLGVPFFLTALLLSEAGELFSRLGRSIAVVSRLGGIVLMLLGTLMLLGQLGLLTQGIDSLFGGFGYPRLLEYL